MEYLHPIPAALLLVHPFSPIWHSKFFSGIVLSRSSLLALGDFILLLFISLFFGFLMLQKIFSETITVRRALVIVIGVHRQNRKRGQQLNCD